MTKTMQDVDTSPDLKRLLTEGLMSYFRDTPYQLEGPEEIQHLALHWFVFMYIVSPSI